MRVHLRGGPALLLLIAVVFGPGLVLTSILHNRTWAIVLPIATIALCVGIAALPVGREISPEQYADELERHLSGTDGDYEWDTTSSVRLKNPRLEGVRRSLPQSFDQLASEEDRARLKGIVDELRGREWPNHSAN